MTPFDQALLLVIVPTITSAIVAPLFVNWQIDKYRARDARALEELKSEQRRFETQFETRFSWLHQKRAEAIVELHTSAYELHRALHILLLPHFDPGDDSAKETIFKALRDVTEASQRFHRAYVTSSIYFRDNSVTDIAARVGSVVGDKITSKVTDGTMLKGIQLKGLQAADIPALIAAADLTDLEADIEALRSLLRTELGATETWNPGG